MRTTIVFLLFLARSVSADQWTKVAPADQLGAWTIVADPHDPNVLYADGSGSRLWKTVDGGANWSATTLSAPNSYYGTTSVITEVARPSAITVLYFSGGDMLARSIDGGSTSTTSTIKEPITGSPSGVAVDAQNASVLYISLSQFCFFSCTRGGVIKSTNGGRNWSTLLADVSAAEIYTDPVTSNIVYVNTSKGIQRSMDGGATWRTILSASTGAFLMDPGGRRLYAIGNFVMRSDDRGETWTSTFTTPPQSWLASRIFGGAVNPNDPDDVAITRGTGGVYRSRDGGARWAKVPLDDPFNPGFVAAVHELSFTANGVLWAASANAGLHFLDTTSGPPPVVEEPLPPAPPLGPPPLPPTPHRRAVRH